jgi:hypothetical protein
MEAPRAWTAFLTIAAVVASFAFSPDAASPTGDGMILGCLRLSVPPWPITMPFWPWYVVARLRDAGRRHRAPCLLLNVVSKITQRISQIDTRPFQRGKDWLGA